MAKKNSLLPAGNDLNARVALDPSTIRAQRPAQFPEYRRSRQAAWIRRTSSPAATTSISLTIPSFHYKIVSHKVGYHNMLRPFEQNAA
jgi:hypothetical protein